MCGACVRVHMPRFLMITERRIDMYCVPQRVRLWKFIFVAGALMLLGSFPAFAQIDEDPPPHTGYDCWIGNDGKPFYTNYIRCIADRDIPPEQESDNPSSHLLDALHRELHSGTGGATEREFNAHAELVREGGGVFSIRIHSYPSDWSWEEGMPERLVRAVLCKGDLTCLVMIRRH